MPRDVVRRLPPVEEHFPLQFSREECARAVATFSPWASRSRRSTDQEGAPSKRFAVPNRRPTRRQRRAVFKTIERSRPVCLPLIAAASLVGTTPDGVVRYVDKGILRPTNVVNGEPVFGTRETRYRIRLWRQIGGMSNMSLRKRRAAVGPYVSR